MSKQFTAFLNDENESVLTLEQLQSFTKKEQEQVKNFLLTDTWFATNRIFRNPSLPALHGFHADIAYSYPQPDPTKRFSDWSQTKERVCLAFRGAAKSTIESAYIAQVILAFPDVRILMVGATLPKAEVTVDAVRQLLNYNPIVEYFFPDAANIGNGKSFTVPTRTNTSLREETLTATSFRACSTGWHGEIILMDDCIHEQNQGTDAAISKSISRYEDLYPMLEPQGYISYTGTRHAINDIPTQMIRAAATNGTPLSLVQVPIFTVKENQPNQAEIDARKKAHKLNLQTDIIPTWPDRWPWQTIASKYALQNFDRNYLMEIFEAEAEPAPQALTPEILNKCVTQEQADVMQVPVLNADMANVGVAGKDCCAIVGGFWNLETHILTVTGIVNKKFVEKDDFLRQLLTLHKSLRFVNLVRFRCENNKNEEGAWKGDFNKLQMTAEFQTDSSLSRRERDFEDLSDAIRRGKVIFGADIANFEWRESIKQLCNFYDSRLEHDDVADSLGQLWRYCQTITNAVPHTYPFEEWGTQEAIQPFACRPCDTVKIRRPDEIQQPVEYADPFYARAFSVNKYDTPL